MIYAVIDTNVVVSALLARRADSPPVQIVGKIFSGDIISLYSRKILDEYYSVLRREKFSFSEPAINAMIGAIEQYGVLVEPKTVDEILSDMKDMPFYAVALEKQSDAAYLVTGNLKHFPSKSFIVTAKQMLDILNSAY